MARTTTSSLKAHGSSACFHRRGPAPGSQRVGVSRLAAATAGRHRSSAAFSPWHHGRRRLPASAPAAAPAAGEGSSEGMHRRPGRAAWSPGPPDAQAACSGRFRLEFKSPSRASFSYSLTEG